MRLLAYVVLGVAAALGCSGSALRPGDGGAVVADGSAPPTGRRSFVVTSTIMQQPTDSGVLSIPLPSAHKFTMVLDWDGRTAILGTGGTGTTSAFQTTATGGTISPSFSFTLGTGMGVSYQSIEVTVTAAGALTGTGRGSAFYQPANTDVGRTGPVTMTLSGVRDTEVPRFTPSVGSAPIDPFNGVTVAASEPLPPTTRLALVNTRSERVELVPLNAQAGAAYSFGPSPFRMWRYGEQYSLVIDASVADFAGNSQGPWSGVIFATIAPPPLAAEDGFESATGTTFASAQVLSGSGAPTLAGARSLYIPSLPDALPPGRAEMMQLAVRIALDATDTVVRFSYRTVNPTSGAAGPGPAFLLGAPGSEIRSVTLPPDSGPPVSATLGQGAVMLGPLMTAELALPPGAASAGELTIIRKIPACCYGLPAPPVAGLILDDLRAE